jgi:hypothetical protein
MISYLRVPKTASTAVGLRLESLCSRTGIDVCGKGGHREASWFTGHDHSHEWVTMIRDPFEQAISFFTMMQRMNATKDWRKNPTPDKNPLMFQPQDPGNMALINGTVEEWLDACPTDQFYSYYYSPLDPLDFTFVGVVEEFDRSMELMNAMLGTVPLFGFHGNVNPGKAIGERYAGIDYSRDDWLARNPRDHEMYERGLERFSQLCQQYSI